MGYAAACLILLLTAAPAALAQGTEPEVVPLQVEVVLSRYQGDEQVSSLPFTLLVNANATGPAQSSSLRMGVNVPIPMRSEGVTTVQYRDVGTQIDCRATSSEGQHDIFLSINDSSLYEPAQGQPTVPSYGGHPVIRSFRSTTTVQIGDGETMQYTMATDKISGEVMMVDVTVRAIRD